MSELNEQLIVALDVDTFDEAKNLIDKLVNDVAIFKVGSQLFTACGPEIVRYIFSLKRDVFLDLKFHDIPNTVANAVGSATRLHDGNRSIFMCTVHIVGGKEMLTRSVEAVTKTAQAIGVKRPLLVGITVLTSEEKKDNIHKFVLDRARLAKESGLDGVVASSEEASMLRENFGEDFIVVTPGIRPEGAEVGDQKRVTTPAQAIANGSDFLVVGRPIVKAKDPSEAAKQILEEIHQASN